MSIAIFFSHFLAEITRTITFIDHYHYVKTAEQSSFEQVNHAFIDIHNQLRIEDLNLCADHEHEELLNAVKYFAEKCYLTQSRTEKPLEAYQACLRIVDHYQVKLTTSN